MKYIVMWKYFYDGDFASGMAWGISEHCSIEDAEEEFEAYQKNEVSPLVMVSRGEDGLIDRQGIVMPIRVK
jgi:hypothetical protein